MAGPPKICRFIRQVFTTKQRQKNLTLSVVPNEKHALYVSNLWWTLNLNIHMCVCRL